MLAYFYPRSPCGERRFPAGNLCPVRYISIHALLAESDYIRSNIPNFTGISIHALLAESDAVEDKLVAAIVISIHALLAESDHGGAGDPG